MTRSNHHVTWLLASGAFLAFLAMAPVSNADSEGRYEFHLEYQGEDQGEAFYTQSRRAISVVPAQRTNGVAFEIERSPSKATVQFIPWWSRPVPGEYTDTACGWYRGSKNLVENLRLTFGESSDPHAILAYEEFLTNLYTHPWWRPNESENRVDALDPSHPSRCNAGGFRVHELEFAADGSVFRFAADFKYLGADANFVRGFIRYNASDRFQSANWKRNRLWPLLPPPPWRAGRRGRTAVELYTERSVFDAERRRSPEEAQSEIEAVACCDPSIRPANDDPNLRSTLPPEPDAQDPVPEPAPESATPTSPPRSDVPEFVPPVDLTAPVDESPVFDRAAEPEIPVAPSETRPAPTPGEVDLGELKAPVPTEAFPQEAAEQRPMVPDVGDPVSSATTQTHSDEPLVPAPADADSGELASPDPREAIADEPIARVAREVDSGEPASPGPTEATTDEASAQTSAEPGSGEPVAPASIEKSGVGSAELPSLVRRVGTLEAASPEAESTRTRAAVANAERNNEPIAEASTPAQQVTLPFDAPGAPAAERGWEPVARSAAANPSNSVVAAVDEAPAFSLEKLMRNLVAAYTTFFTYAMNLFVTLGQ